MTGKVINLRAARKAKTRAAAKSRADENAARHGRSKAERAQDAAEADKSARHLDGHKREE